MIVAVVVEDDHVQFLFIHTDNVIIATFISTIEHLSILATVVWKVRVVVVTIQHVIVVIILLFPILHFTVQRLYLRDPLHCPGCQ